MSFSSLRISENGDDRDSSPDGDELAKLLDMFPTMKRYTIVTTLERCGGNSDRAIDELLNRTFLDEDEEVCETGKGVDAFEHQNYYNVGRKKRKSRKMTSLDLNATEPAASDFDPDTTASVPVWDRIKKEIDFISTSLNIPVQKVTSVYHSHGSKLAPTVASLLDTYTRNTSYPASDSTEHLNELRELSSVFTTVKPAYLDALLRLCSENKTAVFTLADLLSHYRAPSPLPTVSAAPKPTAPQTRPRARTPDNWVTIGHRSSYASPPPSPHQPMRMSSTRTAAHASSLKSARNIAFEKASRSYRRSRSDRNFGGAAAYYADMGKDLDIKAKDYANRAAEQMVNENSEEFMLDLHGVTVPQAVKIARERTTQWWVHAREEGGRGVRPLVIVTGMGKHSKDGNPRLFPAVSKMLVRENWKIRVEPGQLVVLGAAAKK